MSQRPSIEELRAISFSDYCDSIKYMEEQIDDVYELMLAAAKAGDTEVKLFDLNERVVDYFTQLGFTIKKSSVAFTISWYPERAVLGGFE